VRPIRVPWGIRPTVTAGIRVIIFAWVPLVTLAAVLLGQAPRAGAEPVEQAAGTTAVTIFDNDAPGMTFDPEQAFWGFGPHNILVRRGDKVVFYNPSSNKHPHTVTSLERVGPPFNNRVDVGTRFDSSPSAQALVQPGQSFTVDTASLHPGNYPYFCKLHPWMVAELTVADRIVP
jgi:plastocyanin